MFLKRLLSISLLVGMSYLFSACSSSGSRATLSASIKNATSVTSTQSLAARMDLPHALGLQMFRAADIGQTSSSTLQSLKYYITTIAICQSMTTSGSGFSGTLGCINVYTGNTSDTNFTYTPEHDYSNLADAARNHPESFIDLMSASARAALNGSTSLSSSDVGSYNYGYINWNPVLKVRAEVAVGSNTLRTADGASTYTGGGYFTTSTTNFLTNSTAADAVVLSGNGGNWFRFQNPLTIAQADVDAGRNFVVDLTFNPDGLVKGYSNGTYAGCGACTLMDTASPVNAFSVPMLSLTPVARTTTDTTKKEVYQGSVTGTNTKGTDHFDLRIELYYVNSDATKTIYGIDPRTLVNSSTTSPVPEFPKVNSIRTNTDGTIDLLTWAGTAAISGFVRKSEVGQTTTVSINCGDPAGGNVTFKGCGSSTGDSSSLSATLTLTSISELE